MLQEITEDDIQYIHASMSKTNLLIIYNELRDHQGTDDLDLENKFYFKDDFYWDKSILQGSLTKLNINKMISGIEKYNYKFRLGVKQSLENNKWINFINYIKNKYSDKHSWAKNNDQIEKYLVIILNKLDLIEEYYNNVIIPVLLEDDSDCFLTKKVQEKEVLQLNEGVKLENKIENQKTEEKIEIPEKEMEKKKNAYIYGIKIDGELSYIGKTFRSIKERIAEHIECVLDENIKNSQQDYLYKAMRECNGYKFEILYESHEIISNYELEKIEKTLIENIKPKFNYEGVKVPYRFSYEK